MTATPGAREFIGYGRDCPPIRWPGGARVAVSLVVNFEEGSERTPLNGDATAEPSGEGYAVPSGYRDLRAESIFDYGSRVGFWRLLEIFERQRVKATYFICANALELNPEAGREITACGHEPACHGYRWLPTYSLGEEEERRHMAMAVAAIERLTGERPRGWYSRGASEFTHALLAEEGGFIYGCDSYADDIPYFISLKGRKWLVVPYSLETNDMKFYRPPGLADPDDFFGLLKAAFDCLYEEGATHPKMISVGLHMRVSGRPGRAAAVERFIRYAKGFPGVWFARRLDIARWFYDSYGDLPVFAS